MECSRGERCLVQTIDSWHLHCIYTGTIRYKYSGSDKVVKISTVLTK